MVGGNPDWSLDRLSGTGVTSYMSGLANPFSEVAINDARIARCLTPVSVEEIIVELNDPVPDTTEIVVYEVAEIGFVSL